MFPRRNGFTLIEVLVALAVFGVMSMLAYAALGSTLSNADYLTERMERLRARQPRLAGLVSRWEDRGEAGRHLLARMDFFALQGPDITLGSCAAHRFFRVCLPFLNDILGCACN